MTIAAIVGWGLFLLMVLIYLSFSHHMSRRVEALSEYAEFLFQNRAVYNDHRAKYIDMLRKAQSPSVALGSLALLAKHRVDAMADTLHGQAAVSNAFGRAKVDDWSNRDSAVDVIRADLSKHAAADT